MELEFQQIELRYEHLRRRNPALERQLTGSLAGQGQKIPVVVLAQGNGFVLLDGYKRVRALRHLGQDTVLATVWDLGEAEALVLERMMRSADPQCPLEQGWTLRELRDRFQMDPEELARRFDRSASWVSRRLGLVHDLPGDVQEQVLLGRISPYTAMRVLVPLARTNRKDCWRFCQALLKGSFTTREAVTLQSAWFRGKDEIRERLLADPVLFLRSQRALATSEEHRGPYHLWLEDLGTLAAVARRARLHLGRGGLYSRNAGEVLEARAALRQAFTDCQALFRDSERDLGHA